MPEKLVRRATRPPRAASVSSTDSAALGRGRRLESARSAPSSARAWPCTESRRLSVKESIATSAATPTAIEPVSRSSRRGAARISRAAMCSTKPSPLMRERSRGGIGDDLAVGQADGAPGAGGEIEVVGHQDQGRAKIPVELRHEVDDGAAGAGVEVAGGFVGEQHAGPRAERTGQRDPPLLAARELGGIVVAAVAEADAPEQLRGTGAGVLAAQLERDLHVLAGGERGDELER